MIDPNLLTISQTAAMCSAHRILGDERMVPVKRLPHEHGYFAAQAAGFALLAEIEAMHDFVEAEPPYLVYGSLPEERFSNDRREDAVYEMRARAMSSGVIHALSIARALRRPQGIVDVLAAGVECQALWAAMTVDQRTFVTHDPYDDHVDELLAA